MIASGKSVLTGDDVADLLMEYAALLGRRRSADSVDLHVLGPDGNRTVLTLLLNSASDLVVETTDADLPEPDNGAVERYLRERIAAADETATPSEAIAGADVWNGPAAE